MTPGSIGSALTPASLGGGVGYRGPASQRELQTDVGRDEAEPLVEPARIGARHVRRELDERAAASAGLLDDPPEHRFPEPAAALIDPHSHGLDLGPQGALPGEGRDDGELQRPQHLGPGDGDDQQLGRVGGDPRERPPVGRQVRLVVRSQLAPGPERVVGQESDQRREVGVRRPPQRDPRGTDSERPQLRPGQRDAARSVSARTCRQASWQASSHSPNARSKNECGAPS